MDFERLKSSCYEIHEELIKLNSEIEPQTSAECQGDIITMLQSAAEHLLAEKRKLRDQLKEQCDALINEILHKSHLISVEADFESITSGSTGSSAENAISIVKPPYHPLLKKLMLKLECLNSQVSQRSQRENKARLLARELSAKMVLPEPTPPNSLSEHDLSDFETRVQNLKLELKGREEKAASYWKSLEFHSSFIGEKHHPDILEARTQNSALSSDFLEKLKKLSSGFEVIYRERANLVKDLESQVQSLAEALATPPDLPATDDGSGSQRRIELLQLRLSDLNKLKLQKIDLFIENSRRKLRALWDKVFLDESQRQLFNNELPSEGLLNKVEAEVRRLELLLEDSERQPILSYLSKYQQILINEQKLAEMSSDPSRLARRGFAASLKQEEKLRRWNSRHKPETIIKLNELMRQWAYQHPDETFFVNGKSLPELLVEESASLSSSQRRQTLTRKRAPSADIVKGGEKRRKISATASKPSTLLGISAQRSRGLIQQNALRQRRASLPNLARERIPIPNNRAPRVASYVSKQTVSAISARPRPLTAVPPSRLNLPSSTPGRPSNIMQKPIVIMRPQQSPKKSPPSVSAGNNSVALQRPTWESVELRRMQDMEISYFDETSVQQPSFDYERDAF